MEIHIQIRKKKSLVIGLSGKLFRNASFFVVFCEPDLWNETGPFLPPLFGDIRAKLEENPDMLDGIPEGYCVVLKSSLNEEPDRASQFDYVINDDGSVACKRCGEVLPSRTHWYRHKYKTHEIKLFRCEHCNSVFRSKKGYEGHVEARHPSKARSSKRRREWKGLTKFLEERNEKRDAELVQAIIKRVKEECEREGEDINRRGYVKHCPKGKVSEIDVASM